MKNIQQSELLKMLDKTISIFEKHNIDYALAYGTCLGAVRHKGFIPWDKDIDIYIKYTDISKIIDLFKCEIENDYVLLHYRNNKNYSHLFPRLTKKDHNHLNLHIDFFPLIEVSEKPYSLTYMKILSTFLKLKSIKSKKYSTRSKRILAFFLKPVSYLVSRKTIIKSVERKIDKSSKYNSRYYVSIFGSYKEKETFEKTIFDNRISVLFENIDANIPSQYDLYLTNLYGEYLIPKKY